MYNKTNVLACAQSLVGFRRDSNAVYTSLYNVATATAGNGMTFDAATKTITWAGTGNSFEDEGFVVGDSLTITLSTSNNGTFTVTVVADNVITVSEALVNEVASITANIQALSILQKTTSGKYVNDLPGVNFEVISAALSNDAIGAKDYLNGVMTSELIEILDRFVNRVKNNYTSKELLSNQSIVSGVQSFNDKVTQNARFVGFWIRPHSSNNLNIQLTQLGFQSDAIQSNLKIYLYVTSQIEPLQTVTFNVNKASSLVWQDVTEWILRYESETTGTGQHYLLGYYENDPANVQPEQLQGQALFMQFDCNCPGSAKKFTSPYMGILPIEIPNAYLNWNGSEYDIPLVDHLPNYTTNQTYGLLAKVNVTCEISTVLCTNIQMFAEALNLAVAQRILYDAYASNRINSVTDSKREQDLSFAKKYDGKLNGYTTPDGIKIKGVLDTLTIDFSALDKYCLPCATGMTMGKLIR